MSSTGTDALMISLQVDLDTIGLKYLHYTLIDRGFSSVLLYLPEFKTPGKRFRQALSGFLADLKPNFIGLSLMSHEYFPAVNLTRFLKQCLPRVPVIWGGVHPTIAPDMCLDHADYVCIGEGETAVLDLAEAFRKNNDIMEISNIGGRSVGSTIRNPLAPRLPDLDKLPVCEHVPRSGFIEHRRRIVPLERRLFARYARWRGIVYSAMGSRGCPFACSYCCNDFFSRLYNSRQIRRRSVSHLIGELVRAVTDNPGIVYINFHDDCFLACSDDYLKEFCEAYQKRVGRYFIVRCIPSFINEERLAVLKQAGLAWISMGLQSGSDRILSDVYNRHSGSRDFLAAARMVNKFRIAAYYDVILDNPLESDADRRTTVQVLSAVPKPYFLQLFSLALYPGTALRERLVKDRPDLAEQYLYKNYHQYQHTRMNRLIRISAYLPSRFIHILLSAAANPRRQSAFAVGLRLAGLLSALAMEPLTYFRVIRISQQGSFGRTVKQLPAFFRVGISRYVKQFSGGRVTLGEWLVRDRVSYNAERKDPNKYHKA